MYRPTFAFDAIGRDDPKAVRIGQRLMRKAVMFLADVDIVYLQELPGQFKPLYQAGIRYGDDKPAPGTACGDDDWRDIATLHKFKVGDCEELAAARIAELRYFRGVNAVPAILLQRDLPAASGGKRLHLYHIMVRWVGPDRNGRYDPTVKALKTKGGSTIMVECPSEILGMRPASLYKAA